MISRPVDVAAQANARASSLKIEEDDIGVREVQFGGQGSGQFAGFVLAAAQ